MDKIIPVASDEFNGREEKIKKINEIIKLIYKNKTDARNDAEKVFGINALSKTDKELQDERVIFL